MRERAVSIQHHYEPANDIPPVVYVVDDDPVIRRALEFLLTAVGYRVVLCADGHEFLDRFVPGLPGCLVLDVRMPGMSGLELQTLLQRRAVQLPTIMISGNVGTSHGEDAVSAGAVAMIAKPFDNHVLLEHVHAAIAGQQGAVPTSEDNEG